MMIKKACAVAALAAVAQTAIISYSATPAYSEPAKFSFDNRLVDAVEQNNFEIVSALIQSGEDVNSTGKFYTSALQRAAYNGNIEIIDLLLRNGADVNNIDYGGASALHVAARQGQPLVAKTLLQKGADIDAQDEQGYTPLHRAVSNGKLNITHLLIQAGANINTVNNEGNSPLIDAVRTSNLSIVKELLTHGADKTIRNNKGEDVLDYAMRLRNREIDFEMARNYDNIVAQNDAMRQTGLNDDTPDFIRQEAAATAPNPRKNIGDYAVAKVAVAKVDVEELKPAPRIKDTSSSSKAPKSITKNYAAETPETKPVETKTAEVKPASAPEIKTAPEKSWIKTTGTQAAENNSQPEDILPKSMKISDNEQPVKLTDVEHTGASINIGSAESSEPTPAPRLAPEPVKNDPAKQQQLTDAIKSLPVPVEEPKIEEPKNADTKPVLGLQVTRSTSETSTETPVQKNYNTGVPTSLSNRIPAPQQQPPQPQANIVPIDKDYMNEVDSLMDKMTADPAPTTQPSTRNNKQSDTDITVSDQPIRMVDESSREESPDIIIPGLSNNSFQRPVGNGVPASLIYKDLTAGRTSTPLVTAPSYTYSAPAPSTSKSYENDVDALLNDYAQTIPLDKNYANDVNAFNGVLLSPTSPTRNLTIEHQQQQVTETTIKYPEPRKNLATPEPKLEKNLASIPVQDENGQFIEPEKPKPVIQPVSQASARPFQPTKPRADISPVVSKPAGSSGINYDSYRANLLQNVDEFYNKNQISGYDKTKINELEKERMKNLGTRINNQADEVPLNELEEQPVAKKQKPVRAERSLAEIQGSAPAKKQKSSPTEKTITITTPQIDPDYIDDAPAHESEEEPAETPEE